MNTTSAKSKSSNLNCVFKRSRAFAVFLLGVAFLAAPVTSRGAELKQETLRSWDAYVQTANARLLAGPSPIISANKGPDERRQLQAGEILVLAGAQRNPKPVPSGLIHDWVGVAFIPDTTVDGVLSAVRDYGDYKDFYKPSVVDSKLLATDGNCETYSMRVVNKETVAHTALDMESETCYSRVDAQRWYSVTHTTQVREIRHYGTVGEEELPPDQGSGYMWRLYSIARFEQSDGGVYVEIEAMALSRDIPTAVRWMVNPIVRRVSKNSMLLSLRETEEAVHSAAGGEATPVIASQDCSHSGVPSNAGVASGCAVHPLQLAPR